MSIFYGHETYLAVDQTAYAWKSGGGTTWYTGRTVCTVIVLVLIDGGDPPSESCVGYSARNILGKYLQVGRWHFSISWVRYCRGWFFVEQPGHLATICLYGHSRYSIRDLPRFLASFCPFANSSPRLMRLLGVLGTSNNYGFSCMAVSPLLVRPLSPFVCHPR